MVPSLSAIPALGLLAITAILSFALCLWLRPLFIRYALARPNGRSSHKIPTPQGGGIPVIAAILLAIGAAVVTRAGNLPSFGILALCTIILGVLGGRDDIRPLSATVRLLVQAACVTAVVTALPPLGIGSGIIPGWVETAVIVFAGVWFVNLTNFMDGLDGLTVAAFVPLALGAAVLLSIGPMPDSGAALVALGLAGGLLGFLPVNRPVAKLFLGDVGSLAIGLVGAWLLYQVALRAGLALAIALPFYHLADATITLLRRLAGGEKIWEAHRSHFYQQATDRGFSVAAVSGSVFAVNTVVALAAIAAAMTESAAARLGVLGLAMILTALLIHRFLTGRDARA